MDTTGTWSRGYCCSPSDSKCNGRSFCSDQVGDQNLKKFSCPVDTSKCPYGGNAELFTDRVDSPIEKSESWSSSSIREKIFCRYHIKYSGNVINDKYESYNMHIDVQHSSAKAYIAIMLKDEYRHARVEDISGKKVYERIKSNEEFWILYEPTKYKSGNIKVKSWVEHLGMTAEERAAADQAEKDKVTKAAEEKAAAEEAARVAKLAEEEAARLAKIAEEARIQAEKEALAAKEKADLEAAEAKKKEDAAAEAKAEQERLA